MTRKNASTCIALLARTHILALVLIATGCGGDDASGSGPPPPAPPSALSYDSPPAYVVGVAIAPLDPTVTGTVDSYSISPDLPPGLSLDSSTGRISGTPTETASEGTYTITAENTGGSATFALTMRVDPPDIQLLSGRISRVVVQGTTVSVDVLARMNFDFTGDLAIRADDSEGVFASSVSAAPGDDDNVYVLRLETVGTAVAGVHSGTLLFSLCGDETCSQSEPVPGAIVDFVINVMAPGSAWPGDNLTELSELADAPDWSMYQGNASHTGYVPVEVHPDQFSTRWSIAAIEATGGGYTSHRGIATADGRFFVAGGSVLYARSELDASILWQYDFSTLEYPSVNPPAVKDGVVYIAAGQQDSTYMFSFDTENGTPGFKSQMSSQWEHYLAPTIGVSGVYTNAGTYGGLYAFDTTGNELFFAAMDQTSMWTPAVDEFGVYTYTGGRLQVVDPLIGAVLQEIVDPTFENYIYEIGGSPVLGANRHIFVANYANSILNGGAIGNTLTAFDLQSGTVAWQIPGVYPSTPAYDSGVLYVANENPVRVEARAEADGALLWSWTPPQAGDTNFRSEVLLTTNLVLISTNLAMYAIDRHSHLTVWSYPQVGRLALSRNGILYVQGDDRTVAINLK